MTIRDIKAWIKNGVFFQNIATLFYEDANGKEHLVKMHNEGKINLIDLFSNISKSDTAYDFFTVKNVFEEILPDIEADEINVLKCVFNLINEAKPDLSAYFICEPFIEFCSKNETRVNNLLEYTIRNSEYNKFIPIALIAGYKLSPDKYMNKAIDLIKTSESVEIIKRSIFSIYRMDISKTEKIDEIVELFSSLVDKCETDSILEKILQATYKLSKTSIEQQRIKELIDKILAKGGAHVLHQVVIILQEKDILKSNSLECFFASIQNIIPENKGTIKALDRAIVNLMTHGFDAYKIFEFIRLYINKNYKKFKISELECFLYELRNNKNCILDKFLTDCFFNPSIPVSFLLSEVLSNINDNTTKLKYDSPKIQTLSSDEAFFLAKKALAYMYYQPYLCISYIRSILDFFNCEDINSFKIIFFEFFGLGYPTIIADLYGEENISANEKELFMYSKMGFEEINDKLKERVIELEPPKVHKKICLDYKNSLLEIAYKDASKDSLVDLLCRRIKVLYGTGTFTSANLYKNSLGEITRMEKHEYSRLLSMVPYINPVIMNISFVDFKIETLKK